MMNVLTGAISRQFADQFTRDDDAWLYRKWQRDAAIRISVAEHDSFVAAHALALRRAFRWLIVAMVAAVFGTAVACALFRDTLGSTASFYLLAMSQFALVVGFSWVVNRATTAPARALVGRAEVAPPLDPAEVRLKLRLAQSWSSFAGAPVAIGFLWFVAGPRGDVLDGRNVAWVLGTVMYVLFVGYHAWQKWLAGRNATTA